MRWPRRQALFRPVYSTTGEVCVDPPPLDVWQQGPILVFRVVKLEYIRAKVEGLKTLECLGNGVPCILRHLRGRPCWFVFCAATTDTHGKLLQGDEKNCAGKAIMIAPFVRVFTRGDANASDEEGKRLQLLLRSNWQWAYEDRWKAFLEFDSQRSMTLTDSAGCLGVPLPVVEGFKSCCKQAAGWGYEAHVVERWLCSHAIDLVE